ncbi:hypothetical protein A8H40_28655 [Burkholderia multivorans]|nr:hypothetical protein A8H40_28655 [Burkholderia multivorans]PRE10142.1 hypothetical protein C6P92_23630 [Burkholderia multivorans]PRE73150.1 hypothetical protein C6P86_03455 [Burkholderia multivorans]PRE86593.1 hypothetical protein C6Q00_12420 [Burkholderia multivorans]PRF22947.1 hypothetical protein C6Q03_15070 [Burkholderia multivorans]
MEPAARPCSSELNGMVKDFSDRHREAKLFASKTTKIETVCRFGSPAATIGTRDCASGRTLDYRLDYFDR